MMGGQMWGLLEAQAEALGETKELKQLRAMVDGLQTTLGSAFDADAIRGKLQLLFDKGNSNKGAPSSTDPVASSPNGKAHAPAPPQGKSKLTTAKELAEFLDVKVDRIYELVARKQLRAKRVGRQLRFTQSAIEEFLEQAATSD